jgi:hypothetical protein
MVSVEPRRPSWAAQWLLPAALLAGSVAVVWVIAWWMLRRRWVERRIVSDEAGAAALLAACAEDDPEIAWCAKLGIPRPAHGWVLLPPDDRTAPSSARTCASPQPP